jgi:hypothetical protein
MYRIHRKKPSCRQRKQPEIHVHLHTVGMWIVKALLLPVLTSILCQYLVLWLNHWFKW